MARRNIWWYVSTALQLLVDLRCELKVDAQLQEFGSKYEAETLRNPKKTDLADVIVYVYDSSDTNSFSYISNLRVRSWKYSTQSGCLTSLWTATIQSRSHTNAVRGDKV